MLNWNTLAPFTNFLLHRLHYVSLAFMVVLYTIKIRGILAKNAATEGTPSKGDKDAAVRYSYLQLAMPWELESYRSHTARYVEFALFHIAMAVGIGVAFVMPWGHGFMTSTVVIYGLQVIFGLGALIGVSRFLRRVFNPTVRVISSPDDYFCILLLTTWMVSGVLMAPQASENFLLAYFSLATFFLFYVPFSKISHYVYWFFIRYYVGKHFGHRGVYPKKKVANA